MKFSGVLAKCVGLVCCAALAGCLGPGLTPPRSQSSVPAGNLPNAGNAGTTAVGVVTTPPAAGGAPVVGAAGATGATVAGSAGGGPVSADAGELDAGSEDDGGPASHRR
jgi:hypothetical protein